jgi:hypothetical protein
LIGKFSGSGLDEKEQYYWHTGTDLDNSEAQTSGNISPKYHWKDAMRGYRLVYPHIRFTPSQTEGCQARMPRRFTPTYGLPLRRVVGQPTLCKQHDDGTVMVMGVAYSPMS